MVMGANIGTSVTNIIVALTQAGEREQFRQHDPPLRVFSNISHQFIKP
jgi:Na+/phosphate symporter